MLTPQESWDDFQEVYNEWLEALEGYSEMDLWRENPKGGWCLGQVYQHIINGTLNYQVLVIQELLATEEDSDKEMSELGVISYRDHSFPPRKFKVHRESANEPVAANRIKLRNQMRRTHRAMQETLALLEGNPTSGKFQHQLFGFLDANQWYQNVPMHWRHHLRQKAELETTLGISVAK